MLTLLYSFLSSNDHTILWYSDIGENIIVERPYSLDSIGSAHSSDTDIIISQKYQTRQVQLFQKWNVQQP